MENVKNIEKIFFEQIREITTRTIAEQHPLGFELVE